MARVKISEFNAKTILNRELDILWKGLKADKATNEKEITKYFGNVPLVVKVDQGVKKRGKQGLIGVNFSPQQCIAFIAEKSKLGYSQFLIEELVPHKKEEEQYLSIERVREGMKVLYSKKGGIEVEENWSSIKQFTVARSDNDEWQRGGETTQQQLSGAIVSSLGASFASRSLQSLLSSIIQVMDSYHFSFLEINPLIVFKSVGDEWSAVLLDCAVLADDAGLNPYGSVDAVVGLSEYPVEKRVRELDATTPASLKLKIVNPNGSIWMLLSGGGASLVLADEVADLGYGKKLGNYGEYSGSPSTEDTYLYTKAILQTMLASSAQKKVLIIAGGVANFTDVAKTFKGIIQALDEVKTDLQKQQVKVFVRRGGPNQEKGLLLMKTFLEKNNLLGYVSGPELILTEIVTKAIKEL